MNASSPKTASIVAAIRAGIASRSFYIVPTPDEIPGCLGSKEKKLKCVQQFARFNGWNVTIHDGNGWLLFTEATVGSARELENNLVHSRN
jgi:hypothetical protein